MCSWVTTTMSSFFPVSAAMLFTMFRCSSFSCKEASRRDPPNMPQSISMWRGLVSVKNVSRKQSPRPTRYMRIRTRAPAGRAFAGLPVPAGLGVAFRRTAFLRTAFLGAGMALILLLVMDHGQWLGARAVAEIGRAQRTFRLRLLHLERRLLAAFAGNVFQDHVVDAGRGGIHNQAGAAHDEGFDIVLLDVAGLGDLQHRLGQHAALRPGALYAPQGAHVELRVPAFLIFERHIETEAALEAGPLVELLFQPVEDAPAPLVGNAEGVFTAGC